MSDSYNDHPRNERNYSNSKEGARNNFRGGRGTNSREGGGFRIRLSDNEMRAANVIKEAFNLRSTVAVLGFSLRTLAQMLEEGKLDQVLKEYQNTSGSNTKGQNSGRNSLDATNSFRKEKNKPNPFARPEKPQSKEETKDDTQGKELEEKEKISQTSEEASSSQLSES